MIRRLLMVATMLVVSAPAGDAFVEHSIAAPKPRDVVLPTPAKPYERGWPPHPGRKARRQAAGTWRKGRGRRGGRS